MSNPPEAVILIGCADDLVVSDPWRKHAASGVRGHRPVHALAKKPAESPHGGWHTPEIRAAG